MALSEDGSPIDYSKIWLRDSDEDHSDLKEIPQFCFFVRLRTSQQYKGGPGLKFVPGVGKFFLASNLDYPHHLLYIINLHVKFPFSDIM